MNNLYKNMSPKEYTTKLAQEENIDQVGGKETGACNGNYNNHVMTINEGKIRPVLINAKRCDTLTFINEDDQEREITFGTHPEHGTYGGEEYIELQNSKPEIITLNETGNFVFHDHLDPNTFGSFSVEQ